MNSLKQMSSVILVVIALVISAVLAMNFGKELGFLYMLLIFIIVASVSLTLISIVFSGPTKAFRNAGRFYAGISKLILKIPGAGIIKIIYGSLINKLLGDTNVLSRGYLENTARFRKLYDRSNDSLVKGDLKSAREERWPAARFLEYHLDVPADVEPDIIIDGRMVDGSDPSKSLGPMYIDQKLIAFSMSHSVEASVNQAATAFITGTLASLIIVSVAWWETAKMQVNNVEVLATDFLTIPRNPVIASVIDAWGFVVEQGPLLVKALILLSALIAASAIIGLASGLFAWWRVHRHMIFQAADLSADFLRRAPKEAMVRWKGRLKQRQLERKSRIKQAVAVSFGGWDSGEGVSLAKASGAFRYAGVLNSPAEGASMVLSPMARALHLAIFGQSGTGKTSRVLRPLFAKDVERIMAGLNSSIYVTDGKGTLWRDLAPVAKEKGLQTFIIGTGKTDLGVDLLQGIRPQMAADIMRSVMEQAAGGGSGGDDFWPERASHFMRIAGTLLEAWEYTAAGKKWALNYGMRPYSLMNIYKVANETPGADKWGFRIIEDILDDATFNDNGDLFATVQHLTVPGLKAAMDYYLGAWREMAASTLTGIQSNVSKALSSLESQEPLREKFASGENSDFSISQFWDQKCAVMTNISSIEFGNAGRLILIFLKTLLYIEARKREQLDKNAPLNHGMFVYGDEWQELVTKDLKGVSDLTFINVARSAMGNGGFVIATQTMAALEQAIGEVSARNFIDQFSNLIAFRLRDRKTIDMLQSMASKTQRFEAYQATDYESYEAMKLEMGVDPLTMGAATHLPVDVEYQIAASYETMFSNFNFDGYRPRYSQSDYLDYMPPYQTGVGQHASDNINAVLGTMQSAQWRAEDKNVDYMKSGNAEHNVLRDEDMQMLGDRAVAFWVRGNHLMMDIVEFDGQVL